MSLPTKPVTVTVVFVLTVLALLISASAVKVFYLPPAQPTVQELRSIFPDEFVPACNPKPLENTVFQVCVLLLLPISILAAFLARKLISLPGTSGFLVRFSGPLTWISSLSLLCLMTIPFIHSEFLKLIYTSAQSFWGMTLIAAIAIVLTVIQLRTDPGTTATRLDGCEISRSGGFLGRAFRSCGLILSRRANILWLILGVLLLIPAYPFRLMNISSYALEGHTDAVLYSVAQVVSGKTLLSDLPAQYGLYAELLNPIFQVIGLSVFKFTLVMALILLAAHLFLIKAITMVTRRAFLWFLFILSSALLMTLHVAFISPDWTPYFQYFPIRFFFPALITLQFIYFQNSPRTRSRYVLLGCCCAFALFWNLDSGIPSCGALFACLLVYDYPKARNAIWSVVGLASTLAILLLMLSFKATTPLVWSDLFKYQRLFYMLGFNMFHTPVTLHPWMVVIGAYILGVCTSIDALVEGRPTKRDELVFFLSIMGIGLFSYYQGRSHEYVFPNVIWPALFLCVLFADQVFETVGSRELHKSLLLPCTGGVFLLLVFSVTYLMKVPTLFSISRARIVQLASPKDSMPDENVRFIAKHLGSSPSALILSFKQSSYLAELGLACPMNGPGYSEIILRSDFERFNADCLKLKPSKIFVSVHDSKFGQVLAGYRVADMVEETAGKAAPRDGYMKLYVPVD